MAWWHCLQLCSGAKAVPLGSGFRLLLIHCDKKMTVIKTVAIAINIFLFFLISILNIHIRVFNIKTQRIFLMRFRCLNLLSRIVFNAL